MAQKAGRNTAWSLLFLLAHLWVYTGPWRASPPQAETEVTEPLRLLWFNAWGRPDSVDAVHDYALQHEIQLLGICQAGGGPALRRLAASFPHHVYDHEDRIGVFSKLPLRETTWIAGDPTSKPPVRKWLRAELELGVDVWIGHVQTPNWPAHAAGLENLRAALDERESERGKRPAFLLADLNTTPWAADFRALAGQGWQSARAGTWPTRTWRDPSMPWLRWPIDHVLVRHGVGVTSFAVGPALGSDHYLLFAELQLPRGAAPSE